MEIMTVGTDGAVIVHMTKQDAIALRDDLGQIQANKVSESGDKLHSLLDFIHPADACPVHDFTPEHLGVSDAKRRLANCTGCGHSRFADCHPDQRATLEG